MKAVPLEGLTLIFSLSSWPLLASRCSTWLAWSHSVPHILSILLISVTGACVTLIWRLLINVAGLFWTMFWTSPYSPPEHVGSSDVFLCLSLECVNPLGLVLQIAHRPLLQLQRLYCTSHCHHRVGWRAVPNAELLRMVCEGPRLHPPN